MRAFAHAALAILLSGVVVGTACSLLLLARLQPWWGSVPVSVLWPLARALLFHAFEWTSLLAVPLGVGWFSGVRHERPLLPMLLLLALMSAVQSTVLTRAYQESEAPGQLVQKLISEGRESCFKEESRQVAIPIVGLSWKCADSPPRLSGKLDPWGASFSAQSLRPSDDLRSFELAGLALRLRAPGLGEANIRARQASISGLRSWGRPTSNQFVGRVPFVAASTWALAWLGWRFSQAGSRGRRWLGLGCALVPALTFLFGYLWLDQHNGPGWAYWSLPVGLTLASEGFLLLAAWVALRVSAQRGTSPKLTNRQ
ncbi:MAG: hypothetical protein SFV15_17980 [Polyangiaceae bacterium]|nr:hypothetical protein [Polyangiaceae bacterium]